MIVTTHTDIPELKLLSRGKVRDMYAIDENSILIVATDRMSAFDVIMREPVPYKGAILNQLTLFWMSKFEHLVPNHIIESDVDKYPEVLKPYRDMLEGRSVIAKRAEPILIECIVRGYISGSAWKSYKETGLVNGIELPKGLKESDRLEKPLFTPSTKAALGEHDENISPEQAAEMIGRDLAEQMGRTAIAMYEEARDYAAKRGIIIADTKFEFGLVNGEFTLIDEVLTPDSSRFWSAADYEPGHGQPSFDKQYLRDWLDAQDWDKKEPAPVLPQEVIDTTAAKYREALEKLTR